jgi:hypothetical protein
MLIRNEVVKTLDLGQPRPLSLVQVLRVIAQTLAEATERPSSCAWSEVASSIQATSAAPGPTTTILTPEPQTNRNNNINQKSI